MPPARRRRVRRVGIEIEQSVEMEDARLQPPGLAAAISTPPASDERIAIAIDGKTLRGSFDAFSDRKRAQRLSALRQADQIVLGHLIVDEKSNEIAAAPELIDALGLKVVSSRSTPSTSKKDSFERVIASGNLCAPRSRTTNRVCAAGSNRQPPGESRSAPTRARSQAAIAGKAAN